MKQLILSSVYPSVNGQGPEGRVELQKNGPSEKKISSCNRLGGTAMIGLEITVILHSQD